MNNLQFSPDMELSIIVPVYNAVRYLPKFTQSISSLLAEHRDVELIMIDDGSTDESRQLLDAFAAEHPQVTVLGQPNKGVSEARNAGLRQASGRYISFADPDDWLDDDYMQTVRMAAKADSFDVAVFSFKSHDKFGVKQGSSRPVVGEPVAGVEYLLMQLKRYREIERPSWNKLYNAEFLRRIDARFPPGVKLAEDMIFNIHAFYHAEKVLSFDEVIYHYNKTNEASLTALLRADPVFSLTQRIALSSEMRRAVSEWPDTLEVRARLLGFAYRETLRMSVKSIKQMADRRERRKSSRELLAELRNYSLREVYPFLTLTDLRIQLRLQLRALSSSRIYRSLIKRRSHFAGSDSYWRERYAVGGNSGPGSYNRLAEFKADVLNDFVRENGVMSVIDYGCGDGNQLSLAHYPEYLGFDVSPEAISNCEKRFSGDKTKSFKAMNDYDNETADLALSLDVIYHLVEDDVYTRYMDRLFDSANRYVVVYSSDTDDNPPDQVSHVRHRNFSRWVSENRKDWRLLTHIPNKYPFEGNSKTGSFADFYIYART
jgi:glycosyltransferase involved in cell wall biosynthesis